MSKNFGFISLFFGPTMTVATGNRTVDQSDFGEATERMT